MGGRQEDGRHGGTGARRGAGVRPHSGVPPPARKAGKIRTGSIPECVDHVDADAVGASFYRDIDLLPRASFKIVVDTSRA